MDNSKCSVIFTIGKEEETMKEPSIEETRSILAEEMKKYVEIILKEFHDVIPTSRQDALRNIQDFKEYVLIEDSGTISMFAKGLNVIMPLGAYQIFERMSREPDFGSDKDHKIFQEGEILNNNTYYDYINHVLLTGMTVQEFFLDSLLHEVMHVGGSGGGSALREGMTELKTRELAEKYHLKASRCGYPKEVAIVYKLQSFLGKDIINQISFSHGSQQVEEILNSTYGEQITKLYFEIEKMMNDIQHRNYNHSKFGGPMGHIEKAKAYSKIDYASVYEKIEKMEYLVSRQQESKPGVDVEDVEF